MTAAAWSHFDNCYHENEVIRNLENYTVFNCSQTKFVAIILVLLVFFLCDFSLDRFFV